MVCKIVTVLALHLLFVTRCAARPRAQQASQQFTVLGSSRLNVWLDAKASAQRRSLVGAAERVECVGSVGRGVFGPAMILSESFFVGRESNLVVRDASAALPSASNKHAKLLRMRFVFGCSGPSTFS